MSNFQPFLDHPEAMEYKTQRIGDGLDNPQDIERSHFKNVIEFVDLLQTNLEEDLRVSNKNINHLRECINNIDEVSRENLSAITKDIGNKIIFMYDNLATAINDQRCMNLHLQMEIANLTKEKNTLRHEIKNLAISVKKTETFMGVDSDPKFDGYISTNIFK